MEETEIGPNNRNPEEAPTQGPVQEPVLEEEPIGNENLEAGLPTTRGPGRPKKIFSGRPGRPRKQYQMVIDNQDEDIEVDEEAQNNEDLQIDENIPVEEDNNGDEQQLSDEENEEWHDGPDGVRWKDADGNLE